MIKNDKEFNDLILINITNYLKLQFEINRINFIL
jgi:hypothetical protein